MDIRKDDTVRITGSERRIRDLTESMITYANHANQANYLSQRQEKKAVNMYLEDACKKLENDGNLEKLSAFKGASEEIRNHIDYQFAPIELNFSDVQNIAYSMGVYYDSRSWFQRVLMAENPLDARVQEHEKHYERFKETGFFKENYFDEDFVSNLSIVVGSNEQTDLRRKCLRGMFEKAGDYINRQRNLLRLADSKYDVFMYYADGNYGEDSLLSKEIKEVVGCFRKQAEIDGILFKASYFAYLKLQGDPNPEEEAEKAQQAFMNSYK